MISCVAVGMLHPNDQTSPGLDPSSCQIPVVENLRIYIAVKASSPFLSILDYFLPPCRSLTCTHCRFRRGVFFLWGRS